MNTKKLVGQTAYFKIRNASEMGFFGINEDQFHAKVVGIDGTGIWISNPKWETTRIRDEEGDIIPPDKRKKEVYTTHVLIFWHNIISVMTCPGREGFDVDEAVEIGVIDEARYL